MAKIYYQVNGYYYKLVFLKYYYEKYLQSWYACIVYQ